MSTSVATTTLIDSVRAGTRASFVGLLRGELRKIAHMRVARVLAALYALLLIGSQLLLLSGSGTQDRLRHDPLGSFYVLMEGDLSLVRVFSGIILLILAAHVIGLEYQQGTIRVLLGRGVGRLQLLGAKVAALAVVALAIMAGGMLIELAFGWGIVTGLAGSARPWTVLGAEFWTDVEFYLLCVLLNAGVTLLLGVAASVVGRSLSFGLAVGLSWFAVDNLAQIPLLLLVRLTHSDVWSKVTGLLLGPILNRLPDEIAPPYHVTAAGPHGPVTIVTQVSGFGIQPLVQVSGTQALLVLLVYSAVFAAAAIVLTKRRDVLE
jgi:ABC-2 type transport system permease protein